MQLLRGIKIRLLPTEDQEKKLFNIIDGCTFTWNWALHYQIEYFKRNKQINSWKVVKKIFRNYVACKYGEWLRELPQLYLNEVFEDLADAYMRFFKIQKTTPGFTKNVLMKCKRQKRLATPYEMNGHPKFKKKREKLSFSTGGAHTYFKYSRKTHLLEGLSIQKCGAIKIQTEHQIPTGIWTEQVKYIKRPSVVYDNGKWMFNFSMYKEYDQLELNNFSVGIDLGIKKTAVISFSNQIRIFENINKTNQIKQLEKDLIHFQRRLSKKIRDKVSKVPESKGAIEIKNKIKSICKKLSNIRKNYIHHITKEIVSLHPKSIVMETLNIIGMMKNHHIAKSVMDQLFAEFKRQILYKAEQAGIPVIFANMWYPSSKLCSNCGHKIKYLPLSQRIYKCEKCGMILDRDVNAAKNLEALG